MKQSTTVLGKVFDIRQIYIRKIKLNSCICEFTKYLLLRNVVCIDADTIFVFQINNGLGTKEGLTELCTEAHQYGVKIIVDVVANHTNGSLSYVASFWQDQSLYHDYQGGIDYSNRWQVTHGKLGMWDLKTEDSRVQEKSRSMWLS